MAVVLVFEENVLSLIDWYVLRGMRCLEDKQSLYDELRNEWNMHSVVVVVSSPHQSPRCGV